MSCYKKGIFMRKKGKAINEDMKAITKNTEQANVNLGYIKSNTDILVQNSKSRLPIIIAIIGTTATVIGTIATIIGIIISNGEFATENSSNKPDSLSTAISSYEIYLYPDYKRLTKYFETDITATLNFDTNSISITAYLDSVKDGDTIEMAQKNSKEWQAKVYFEQIGIYEVVATATAPDGTIVEGSVKIEVVP